MFFKNPNGKRSFVGARAALFAAVSLAVAFAQIFGAGVFAAAPAPQARYIRQGDYVRLGRFNSSPILWRAVSVDNGKALMLAADVITARAYDAKGGAANRGQRDLYGSDFWADSNIRHWLNGEAAYVEWGMDNVVPSYNNAPPSAGAVTANPYSGATGFLYGFSASDRARILTVKQQSILSEVDSFPNAQIVADEAEGIGAPFSGKLRPYAYDSTVTGIYNSDSYNILAYAHEVTDKVFLLDVKQLSELYSQSYLLGENFWKPSTGSYFLRTPRADVSADKVGAGAWVRAVNADGTITEKYAYDGTVGIRPAFYMETALGFEGKGTGEAGDPYEFVDLATDNPGAARITSSASHTFGAPYKLTSEGGAGYGAIRYYFVGADGGESEVNGGSGSGEINGDTLTVTRSGTFYLRVEKQDAQYYFENYGVPASYNGYNGGSTFILTVSKATLAEPVPAASAFKYDGTEKRMTFANLDASLMSISGDEIKTDAGAYTVYVSLLDTDNYRWADGSTARKEFPWVISKGDQTPLVVTLVGASGGNSTTFGASGNLHRLTAAGGVTPGIISYSIIPGGTGIGEICTSSGVANAFGDYIKIIRAGTVRVRAVMAGTSNYNDATGDVTLTVAKAALPLPSVDKVWTYDGTTKTITAADFNTGTFDATKMTLSGTLSGTAVGEYPAVVAIIDSENYEWTTGGTGNITVVWRIGKTAQTPIIINGIDVGSDSVVYAANSYYAFDVTGGSTGATPTYAIRLAETTAAGAFMAGTNKLYYYGIGIIAVRVTMPGNDTYESVFTDFTLTITKGTGPNIAVTAVNGKTDGLDVANGVFTAVYSPYPQGSYALTVTGASVGAVIAFSIKSGGELGEMTGNTLFVKGAGTLTILFTVSSDANFYDSEGVLNVTINKAKVLLPSLAENRFEYDGTAKRPMLNGYVSAEMEYYGDIEKIEAGEYGITVALKSYLNYVWADGAGAEFREGNLFLPWKIERRAQIGVGVTVDGKAVNGAVSATYGDNGNAFVFGMTGGSGAVSFSVPDGSEGTGWFEGSTLYVTRAGNLTVRAVMGGTGNEADCEILVTMNINRQRFIRPTVAPGVTYTYAGGSQITLQMSNFDDSAMSKNSDVQVSAGKWTAVVEFKNQYNYVWDNGTYDGVELAWEILKANQVAPVVIGTVNGVTVTGGAHAITYGVTYAGGENVAVLIARGGNSTVEKYSFEIQGSSTAQGFFDADFNLHITKAGIFVIKPVKAGDGNYNESYGAEFFLTVEKAAQSALLSIKPFDNNNTVSWGSSYTLGATGGNGSGNLTFAVVTADSTGEGVIDGYLLRVLHGGTLRISAVRNEDDNYKVSSPAYITLTVLRVVQAAFNFVSANSSVYGVPYLANARGGSTDGSVTYSILSGGTGAAELSSPHADGTRTVTATKAGTVILRAVKTGDRDYLDAEAVIVLTIKKAGQQTFTVNTAVSPTANWSYSGNYFDLYAVGGTVGGTLSNGGLRFEIAAGGNGKGEINGNRLTVTKAKTVVVRAVMNGNDNYEDVEAYLTITVNPNGLADAEKLLEHAAKLKKSDYDSGSYTNMERASLNLDAAIAAYIESTTPANEERTGTAYRNLSDAISKLTTDTSALTYVVGEAATVDITANWTESSRDRFTKALAAAYEILGNADKKDIDGTFVYKQTDIDAARRDLSDALSKLTMQQIWPIILGVAAGGVLIISLLIYLLFFKGKARKMRARLLAEDDWGFGYRPAPYKLAGEGADADALNSGIPEIPDTDFDAPPDAGLENWLRS